MILADTYKTVERDNNSVDNMLVVAEANNSFAVVLVGIDSSWWVVVDSDIVMVGNKRSGVF